MKYLTPNVLISLISSLILVIFIYIINTRNDEKVSKMTLFKYYILNVISISAILFIKKSLGNSDISLMGGGGVVEPNYQANISIGEPNF